MPGAGLTSIALDTGTNTLLATGDVTSGQFPVATVAAPLADTPYQTLLRFGVDGQSVSESVLLVPGVRSAVTPGPGGTAWVSGSLATPVFPGTGMPLSTFGDTFLAHIAASGAIDQIFRTGGLPVTDAGLAQLSSIAGAPAVSATGAVATVPVTLRATAGATLAAEQTFDLPLLPPSAALPNATTEILPSACAGFSECNGSAGLLATITTAASKATFSLSTGDLPNLVLRNTASLPARNLAMTASGYTFATDCPGTLAGGAQCALALSGSGPGSMSIAASNAAPFTAALPATNASAQALALNTPELDFGIVTASNSPVTRTLTVTNLSEALQSFASAAHGVPAAAPYTVTEIASTCGGNQAAHTVPANTTCTVTLGLSASNSASKDGPVSTAWEIGSRDVVITGITQAADLSLSASEVDFGTQIAGVTPPLPRYLYLSNSSGIPIAHAPVFLPSDSPFSVLDGCASTLEPASVCQITIEYAPSSVPSTDSTLLTLDAGLNLLITGTTLAATEANPGGGAGLSVAPASVSFSTPVVTTTLSGATATVSLQNTGSVALPLQASVTGDFQLANGCGDTLAPEADCLLTLRFAPSQPGQRDGLLTLTAGAGAAPTLVPLTGTGAPLLPPNNGSLALGETLVGEPVFAWYRIQSPVASLTAAVTGSAFGVALVQNNGTGHGRVSAAAFAPSVTGSCADCWLGVVFVPQAVGPARARLTLSSAGGGSAYTLAVTGSGTPVQGLVVTPAIQDFGTVPVGSASAPQTLVLANLLTPAAGVSVQSVSATGDFRVVAGSAGGAACSGVLAATASCYVQVAFLPTVPGERTGQLSVVTSGGTATAMLTGSAVADPGLAVSPTSLTFSNEPDATATQQTITLSNRGTSVLSLRAPRSSSPSFVTSTTCASLAPGASCTVNVRYSPGTSFAQGVLSFAVTSSTDNVDTSPLNVSIPLAGEYTSDEAGLLLLPNQVNFGAQATGTLGQTRQFTLRNTSAQTQTITLHTPQQFPLAAPFACRQLAPGASCTFALSFLPETGGAITGTVFATASSTNGAFTQALSYLLGNGSGASSLAVSGEFIPDVPVNFGEVASGQTASQLFTLTNTGNGPLTVRRVVSAPPFFAASTCGQTLAPSASCTVSLTYAPVFELPANATSLMPRTDTESLVIESDAPSSPEEIELQGTAIPATSATPSTATVLASYTLSQGALTFANTQTGNTSAAQTLTLTNTGSVKLTFTNVLAPMDFQSTNHCGGLEPGAACTVDVVFAPGSATTALRTGTLAIQSNATDALEFVSLLGVSSPAPLVLSPATLDFGTIGLGQTKQLAVSVANTAPVPINFGQLSATGDYTVSPGTCPTAGEPLPAGQSCTFWVNFVPTATGTRAGLVSLPSQATQAPLTVTLTGVSVAPQLRVTPEALAFGSVNVGSSAPLPLNLTNAGSATLNDLVFTIGGANSTDFAVTTPCPTNTYSPLAGCTAQITFRPTAAGPRTATLAITSSDPASPLLVQLTGIGLSNAGTVGSNPAAGSFILTVAGGNIATATVHMGTPARYALTVTPAFGFTGPVALTCTPVTTGPYAACSLLGSQFTLGSAPATASAMITTEGGVKATSVLPWGSLLLAPLAFWLQRRGSGRSGPRRLRILGLFLVMGFALAAMAGCGGNAGVSGLAMTPPGTYQYTVTASSTSGPSIKSSVTLHLVITP